MNCNWLQRYRNWPYQYCNWPYRYTDYSMLFTVNQSLSESMQSPTYIECSSVFPSQETETDTFSFSHAKFQQLLFFSLSISLAGVAFSLVNFLNIFQLIASDDSTWLLPSELFRTYSQTSDHVANFSQSKQVCLCNPMCSLQESRYQTSQVYFRLPQSILQVSTKCMYACNTRRFANGSEPTQDKLNGDKMVDAIAAAVHGISNSRL